MTYHSDLTVRFRDLSAQLLLCSDTSPLQASYPNPLPGLTIDVLALLADPAVASYTSPTLLEEATIASAHLAPQSLECAVVLANGEVAVYRLNTPPSEDAAVPKTLDDAELISATHVAIEHNRFFYPAFILSAGRGACSALAMSDIGTPRAPLLNASFAHVPQASWPRPSRTAPCSSSTCAGRASSYATPPTSPRTDGRSCTATRSTRSSA